MDEETKKNTLPNKHELITEEVNVVPVCCEEGISGRAHVWIFQIWRRYMEERQGMVVVFNGSRCQQLRQLVPGARRAARRASLPDLEAARGRRLVIVFDGRQRAARREGDGGLWSSR